MSCEIWEVYSNTFWHKKFIDFDNVLDSKPDVPENNLNRSDSREMQPFKHNIGEDKSKRSNEEGGEVSMEEMNKLIEEAANELELDAKKALTDLQKDKDIMKRLQEIKSRRKDDVNKQGAKKTQFVCKG